MANGKHGNLKNFGNLGNIIPSFQFCPTAKIENSDLKILEENLRDFREFRGFRVFDQAIMSPYFYIEKYIFSRTSFCLCVAHINLLTWLAFI